MKTIICNYGGDNICIDIFEVSIKVVNNLTYKYAMVIIHNGHMFIRHFFHEQSAMIYIENKLYESFLDNFYLSGCYD